MAEFNHVRGRHLETGSALLYVEELGDPSASPLLVLHGGLGSMVDLNLLIRRLPQTRRVIGVDLRGHGRSALGGADLSYAQHERDILGVLDGLDLRRTDVLGFSDGGITAYRLAISAPDRIGRIVAIGATWKTPVGATRERLAGMTAETWRKRFSESVGYYERVNPQPDLERLVDACVKMWTDPGPSGHPNDRVGEIRCPLLATRGHRDPLCSLQETAELCARLTDAEFLNLPYAGHEVHKEADSIVANYLVRFLSEPA